MADTFSLEEAYGAAPKAPSGAFSLDEAYGIQPSKPLLPSVNRGFSRFKQGAAGVGADLGIVSPESAAATIAGEERYQRSIPPPEETALAMREMSEAQSIGDFARGFVRSPGAILSILGESVGQGGPGMALAAPAALGGPLALGGAVGLTSGATEYASSVLDSLREAGIDMADEKSIVGGLSNAETMAKAREHAVKRGVPVGAFDALSAGFAGKIMRLAGGPKSVAGATGRAAGEAAMQAGAGAAGEASAQLASEGQITKPGAVALEAIAEIPTGVVETAVGARNHRPVPAPAPVEQPPADVRLLTGPRAGEGFTVRDQEPGGGVTVDPAIALRAAAEARRQDGPPVEPPPPVDPTVRALPMPDPTDAEGRVRGDGFVIEPFGIEEAYAPPQEEPFTPAGLLTTNIRDAEILTPRQAAEARLADLNDGDPVTNRWLADHAHVKGKELDALRADLARDGLIRKDGQKWVRSTPAGPPRLEPPAIRLPDQTRPVETAAAPPVAPSAPVPGRAVEPPAGGPPSAAPGAPIAETGSATDQEISRPDPAHVGTEPRPAPLGPQPRRPRDILQFIADRGGIIDTGGELKAMDLHRYRPPGMRKLVIGDGTEKGDSLDPSMARGRSEFDPDMVRAAAIEAGYLPEDATISDLYEAMRSTRAGKPVFAREDIGDAQAREDWAASREARREERRSLEQAAEIYDIDPGRLSDKTLRARIADAEAKVERAERLAITAEQRYAKKGVPDAEFIPFDAGDLEGPASAPPEAPREGRGAGEPGGPGRDEGSAGRERGSDPGGRGTAERTDTLDTADGPREQAVIPGAERIGDKELAERRRDERLGPKVEQKPADDGLFDVSGRGQKSLFSRPGALEDLTDDAARSIRPNGTPDERAEDAINWVLEEAARRGNVEVLAAMDGDGRVSHAGTTNAASFVGFSEALLDVIRRPGARATVIHNHPSGSALGRTDMLMLGRFPGARWIGAVTKDGYFSLASATEALARQRNPEAALGQAHGAADLRARAVLQDAINRRGLSTADASRYHWDTVNRALHEIGAITYISNYRPADADTARLLDLAMRSAAKAAGDVLPAEMSSALREGRRGVSDRRADAVRLQDALGEVFGRDERPAAERPGGAEGNPPSRGSAEDGQKRVTPTQLRLLDEEARYRRAGSRNTSTDPETVSWQVAPDLKAEYVASPEWTEARSEAADAVADIVRELAPGQSLTLNIADRLLGDGSPVLGAYTERGSADTLESIVSLAMIDPETGRNRSMRDLIKTLNHEVVHFFRQSGLFTPAEWKILTDAAKRQGWLKTYRIAERYDDVSSDTQIEEAIAEARAAYAVGDLKIPPGLRKLFDRIQQFLDRVRNWMEGNGFSSWQDVMEAMGKGEIGSRTPTKREASGSEFAKTTGMTPAHHDLIDLSRGLASVADVEKVYGDRIRRKLGAEEAKAILDRARAKPQNAGAETPIRDAVREHLIEKADRAWSDRLADERDADVSPEEMNKARGSLFQKVDQKKGTTEQEAIIGRILGSTDKPFGQRAREFLGYWKDNVAKEFRQSIFDQYDAIAEAERSQNAGKLMDASVSAYKRARMLNSGGVIRTLLNDGMVKWDDKAGTWVRRPGYEGGFNAIFEPLAKKGLLRLWQGWAIANRSKRLIQEGRESLLSQSDIDALLKLGDQYPEFREAQQKWSRFNAAVLDMAEDAGLVSKDARRIFAKDDYVPFYRILDGEQKGFSLRKGLAGQRSGIKALTGGEEQINDLMMNMVRNVSHLVDASMKNRAALAAVDLGLRTGALERRGAASPAEAKEVNDLIGNAPEGDRKGYADLLSARQPKTKDGFTVMIDGKPQAFAANDPFFLRAMTSIHFPGFDGMIWNLFQGAKNLLTRSVTAFPDFMLANAMRDSLSSWVVSGGKTTPWRAAKGFADSLKDSASVQAIRAAGADTVGFYSTDPTSRARELNRLDQGKRGRGYVREWWEKWEAVGRASDNANRLALYDRLIKDGATPAEAAYQAMDLMDFSMRGDSAAMRALTAIVPFLNARLQGLYKLGRAGAENPKAFALRGSMIMAASLALLAQNMGDPDYEEIPDNERDTYYHLKVGDTFFKFPKPFEIGAIFSTVPERLVRYAAGQDEGKRTAKRFLRVLADQLNFDPTPQLAKPILEQAMNKIGFTGAPIENMSMQRLRPGDRADDRTSALARSLGQVAPETISPARVDALLRGYFGTLGSYIMGASNVIGDTVTGNERPSRRIEETPVLGRFLREGPAKSTQAMTDFYDLMGEVEQVAASIKSKAKLGDVEGARALAEANPRALASSTVANRISDRMSALRQRIRAITAATGLSADEKRAQIDRLQEQINTLAKQGNERLRQATAG